MPDLVWAGRGTEAVSLCASLSDSANFRKESTQSISGDSSRRGEGHFEGRIMESLNMLDIYIILCSVLIFLGIEQVDS